LVEVTVTLEQFEDYIYQRVFYFYQILSPFNKLKTISEGVLLLPNTVTLEYLVEVEHPLIVFKLFTGDSIL
jgi:hypothetical protein